MGEAERETHGARSSYLEHVGLTDDSATVFEWAGPPGFVTEIYHVKDLANQI